MSTRIPQVCRFTEQLQELKRKFEIDPTEPESRQSVLEELDLTIESLKRIRADLAGGAEGDLLASPETRSPPAGQLDGDTDSRMDAFLQPYSITFAQYMQSGDISGCGQPLPPNCMDAKQYKENICKLEAELSNALTSADTARTLLKEQRSAIQEQVKFLENKAIICRTPIDQREMNHYKQALEQAENRLLQSENSIWVLSRQLSHLVHNIRPIDGGRFKADFYALLQAKLAIATQKRKEEAEKLL